MSSIGNRDELMQQMDDFESNGWKDLSKRWVEPDKVKAINKDWNV